MQRGDLVTVVLQRPRRGPRGKIYSRTLLAHTRLADQPDCLCQAARTGAIRSLYRRPKCRPCPSRPCAHTTTNTVLTPTGPHLVCAACAFSAFTIHTHTVASERTRVRARSLSLSLPLSFARSRIHTRRWRSGSQWHRAEGVCVCVSSAYHVSAGI